MGGGGGILCGKSGHMSAKGGGTSGGAECAHTAWKKK
eukprot:COSAG05_NODE_25786_length_193_cov_87.053191_1_plen_36_part_01